MPASWVDINVSDGTTMEGYLTQPDGDGSHPAVIVIQIGGNSHIPAPTAAEAARRTAPALSIARTEVTGRYGFPWPRANAASTTLHRGDVNAASAT